VPTGTPLGNPPLVQMIAEDPLLRNTKMIAEAWDCDGLNQVRTVLGAAAGAGRGAAAG
jgi:isoamylase